MKCDNCKSNSIAEVVAKCSDKFHWVNLEDVNQSQDGYVDTPGREFNTELGSKYMHFKYCMNCGKIQGDFPVQQKYV